MNQAKEIGLTDYDQSGFLQSLPDMTNSDRNFIKLDQFLKWKGLVQTGGEAKMRIQSGEVRVNGLTETRRGRKLVSGDMVMLQGKAYLVEL